jgi:4-hydroxy 2-oxovalerate aldolase
MLIAVMNRMGYEHGGDLYKAMDASEKILIPTLKAKGIEINSQLDSLIIGYAGVYSSFLLHARRAGERFGVDVRDILMEAGSRKAVGGQEDWLIEIAVELANQKKSK